MNTAEWNDVLLGIPARHPHQLLHDLATYYRQVQQGENLPLSMVRLVLAGGESLKGWVANINPLAGNRAQMLLFSLPEYPDRPEPGVPLHNLAFVSVADVQAVVVVQSPPLLPTLTQNQVPPAVAGNAAIVSPWTRTLADLPVRLIRAVLQDLAAVRHTAAQDANQPIPGVELMLRQGGKLRGWVVAMQQAGDDDFLVLHISEEPWNAAARDLCYLRVSDIVALTVYRADLVLDRLSGGTLVTPVSDELPTKMQLRRTLAQQSEALSDKAGFPLQLAIDWESLPADEMARFHMHNATQLTTQIVDALLDDAMGREALQAVQRVVLGMGTAFQVGLANATLTISLQGPVPPVHELRQAIEKVL